LSEGVEEKRIVEMSVFIQRIELRNYRSCKRTKFPLDKNLSVLIGPNGSGKSNILHALLLLRKVALNTGRYRGEEEETFLSGCKLLAEFWVDGHTVRYQALIKYATNERNVDEVVAASERWNFRDITSDSKWSTIPMSFVAEGERRGRIGVNPPTLELYMWRRGMPLRGLNVPKGASGRKAIAALRAIVRFIIGTRYYSASRFTDPSKCPASFELESDRLSRRIPRAGDEHLQFMYDLYLAYKNHKDEFSEFLSLVGPDGVGLIDSIEYDEIDVPSSIYQVATGGRLIRREVKRLLIIPNIRIGSLKLSPNQLSEGTFRTLGVLFYIITDKSRLLLLEEPEVCIHHGLLASIVELIKSVSRKKQIVISTHSDFVIDAVEPTNVFIVRNSALKGTDVKHLPKSMTSNQYRLLKKYLDSVGNLGEYWRHGQLER
jgi:ABC-type lipoprotein export system ATPase subunit